MPTSPSQQAFRDFVKECNEVKKLTIQALLSGESYTYENVIGFFQPVLEEYLQTLEEVSNDIDKWTGRGEQHTIITINSLVQKYTEGREEQEPLERFETADNQDERILGFPIISYGECTDAGGRVRGQVLLTIDELAEYIAPIPISVITGVVLVKNQHGEVVGFSICGQKTS